MLRYKNTGLTADGAVFDVSYQTTHLTPVIPSAGTSGQALSEAPERFVSYQDHWRGVEGSRECVIYDAVSGSSYENAVAARCGLEGFFLPDLS